MPVTLARALFCLHWVSLACTQYLTACNIFSAESELFLQLRHHANDKVYFVADRAGKQRSGFEELPTKSLVVVAVDNVNVRSKHAVLTLGGGEKGFDGVVMQAVAWNKKFTYESSDEFFLRWLPQLIIPAEDSNRPLREEFNYSFLPKPLDPDIETYRIVLLGSVYEYGARLDGRAPDVISLRFLLLSCFEAVQPTPAKAVFLKVTRNHISEEVSIMEHLEFLKEKYRPGELGNPAFVVIEGDQKTYAYLHRVWLAPYRRRDPGGLWTWLVVLPGGWHMDMTGFMPGVKRLVCGSGLLDLVKDTGLSEAHIAGFENQFSHWRKCRLVLSHATVAMILEAIELCISEDEALRDDDHD